MLIKHKRLHSLDEITDARNRASWVLALTKKDILFIWTLVHQAKSFLPTTAIISLPKEKKEDISS